MKILLTTDTWSPAVNGVVRSVQLLRRELLQLGHDVRVLTLSDSADSTVQDGVYALGSLSVRRIYPGARVNIRPVDPIIKELERWHPDIIHTQSEFTIFAAARRLSRRCGCPLVHTYHTIYEDYTDYLLPIRPLGRQAVRLGTRKIAQQCSLILAPTEKVRRLLNGYGVSCPMEVVPTGIDLSAFCPAPEDVERSTLRTQLELQPEQLLLISVGRLAAEKSHPELLRLLALQPAEIRPHLVFVGDGPAREELEQLTSHLGLDNFVSFIGMVPPEDVVRWYQAGDAFVSASQSETQGLTYFEALACGLPVLCRADPCLDGVVENGRNGWQWQTDAEFSAALDALRASNAAGRATLSACAVETAARYSAENFAQQVLDAYGQVLSSTRSGKARAGSFTLSSTAAALGFLSCALLGIWMWKKGFLTDPLALQNRIRSLGWWAPAAFVVFQAVQVVIPVLPGGLGCLVGVLLFGPLWGFLYNYFGICIGSLMAFGIARQCGRPLLTRMFSPKLLQRYQHWTGPDSHFTGWFALAIFLPVAPDDFLCYLAGTTAMRWSIFALIIFACKPFAIALYSTGLNVAFRMLLPG